MKTKRSNHFNLFALLSALIMAIPSLSKAQVWYPDALFGNGGSIISAVGASELPSNLLACPDGKFILTGYEYDISCNCYYNDMLKIDACGIIDSSFGVDGKVRHTFSQRNSGIDYTLQPDGKILVAGQEAPSNAGSQQIPFVARYLANGAVDSTFNGTGSQPIRFDPISSGTFTSLHRLSDGRIVCTGTSSGNINGGINGAGAMRFLSNGSLDPTFGSGGKVVLNGFPGVLYYNNFRSNIDASHRILMTGRVTLSSSFEEHIGVLALDSSGALDTSFGTDGYFIHDASMATNFVHKTALFPDGSLLLAGDVIGSTQVFLTKLLPNGSRDSSFGTQGSVYLNYANAFGSLSGLEMLADGRILLLLTGQNVDWTFKMAMLLPDGTPDPSFGSNGFQQFFYGASAGYFTDITELPGGEWLASGILGSDFFAARFNTTQIQPEVNLAGSVLSCGISDPELSYAWLLNYTFIKGATDSVLVPISNGDYQVEISDSYGCSLQSAPFNLSSVRTQTLPATSIALFPNPAQHQICLSGLPPQATVAVYNLAGVKLGTYQVGADQTCFSTQQWANGMYLVKVNDGPGIKVSIQH